MNTNLRKQKHLAHHQPTHMMAGLGRSRGVSLIEMMIAMTLGLILLAGVGYAYLGSRQTYRLQDAVARMQESARYAFELLGADIRMAGFNGCSTTTTANTINNPGAWYSNLFDQPLTGYESGISTFPVTVLRGDAVAILRANNANEYIVASHNAPAAQFQLTANAPFEAGDILVVTDCTHTAVFQNTNTTGGNTVVHNTGTGTPGNCTKSLGNPVPSPCAALGTPYTFGVGSRILKLSGNLYFIGTNAAGEPALFRQRLTQSGGTATTVAEEMVESVEDLQVTYGEDTNSDQAVDRYVTANNVTDWSRVLSVKVSLLMRTTENNVTTIQQPYTYNGATTTPSDHRLRKVFTTTITVRNRL